MCGKMNIDSCSCDCAKENKKSVWTSIKHLVGVIIVLALLVIGIQGCMMMQYGIIYTAVTDAIRSSQK